MVRACLRVSGIAFVVGSPVPAKAEFSKFCSIFVPLKDNRFGPVMPNGRGYNDVLIDEDLRFGLLT